MKIGIDISQIVYETGVSVYTKNLVENFLKADRENEYVLFGGSLRRILDLKSQISHLRQACLPARQGSGGRGKLTSKLYAIPPVFADLLWNRLHILPIETFTGRLDVFHSSDWTQPPSSSFKITTIHDLVPIIYPESTRKDGLRNIVRTHLSRLNWVKKEVDRIIAVSESTKRDIISYLSFPEEKIRVVYEAPDPGYRKKDEIEIAKVKNKYGLFGDYLLTVGTGPRKNLDRLVKAYEVVKPQSNLKLAIVGQDISKGGKGIVPVQNSTQPELASLYSGATALVYPSLYEGFGLPILEAFACGCPVVTSNLSSMPEVAGDAAVLVDPNDVDSIADGIKLVIRDGEKLTGKGFKRVKEFSWEKCAKETLEVYKEFDQKME